MISSSYKCILQNMDNKNKDLLLDLPELIGCFLVEAIFTNHWRKILKTIFIVKYAKKNIDRLIINQDSLLLSVNLYNHKVYWKVLLYFIAMILTNQKKLWTFLNGFGQPIKLAN